MLACMVNPSENWPRLVGSGGVRGAVMGGAWMGHECVWKTLEGKSCWHVLVLLARHAARR
jgi:hypothetical protein